MKLTGRQKRSFKKVWRTLKTAFKVLFILIILFLLLSLLKDFFDGHIALIEKVNQQNQRIDWLQGELVNVYEMNFQLEQQLELTQYQLELSNLRIDELVNERIVQQAPSVVRMNGLELKLPELELEPQLNVPELPNFDFTGMEPKEYVPIAVVGVLQVLRTVILRVPVPIF